MKQVVLETRKVLAYIANEGGEIVFKFPVFAWQILEDGTMWPIFVDKQYLTNGLPYDLEQINYVAGDNLGIVYYEWL